MARCAVRARNRLFHRTDHHPPHWTRAGHRSEMPINHLHVNEPTVEASPPNAPPASEISRLAEHFFRHESGKLVSVLTGIFGVDRLHWAEDLVQEAFMRALQTWPYYGVPKNPAAWITQTAKNLALDLIRREKTFANKEQQIIATMEGTLGGSEDEDSPRFEGEIKDERLRLMFVCCHSALPAEVQTALALKTLCGFGVNEIASAFLTSEAAIAKRLTRARERIRELNIQFEIPSGEELVGRLEGVLQTLYLLFNEGYKASSGENLIREELCSEAIRLGTLLVEHPSGQIPRAHALLALMLLNTARFKARTDRNGDIIRLEDQDRNQWNRAMMVRGFHHLKQSAAGAELSEYHLQAAIAACHCAAPDYESTDWAQILSLYDLLLKLNPSPIVALNRAVALSNVDGAQVALDALDTIPNRQSLQSYYLLYAVEADFRIKLKQFEDAARLIRKAMELTELRSERNLLQKRLALCQSK